MIANCRPLTWCCQRHDESSSVAFETRVDAHADIVTIALCMRSKKKPHKFCRAEKAGNVEEGQSGMCVRRCAEEQLHRLDLDS